MNIEASRTTTVTVQEEILTPWPVSWSGVIVGTLAALGVALVIGLIAIAVGAHTLQARPWIDFRQDIGWWAAIFAVLGAFFAFVAGGWVAGKIAGTRQSETGMLHGAIVWLVAIPLLVVLSAIGVAGRFGYWYPGLTTDPAAAVAAVDNPQLAGDAQANAVQRVARNTAIGALVALLLGLVGSVLGGWMASGEPMSFTYRRTRTIGTSAEVART